MQNKWLFYGMVFLLIFLAGLYMVLQNTQDPEREPTVTTPTVYQHPDAEFQAAIDKARASLEYFFDMADRKSDQAGGHSLRVALTDGDVTEFFWVYPFEHIETGYAGILQDEPKQLANYRKGQRIEFAKGDIIDWTFDDTQEEVMHGNFTGCVELQQQAPDHAEQFMELMGLDCSKR